jgi:hypothetical protein
MGELFSRRLNCVASLGEQQDRLCRDRVELKPFWGNAPCGDARGVLRGLGEKIPWLPNYTVFYALGQTSKASCER